MSAPNISATGAWAVSTNGTIAPTLPTHATNNLLIVAVHVSSSGTTDPTISTPSGWTLILSAANATGTRVGRVSVFAKKAASGSETFSSTVTPSGVSTQARAIGCTLDSWNDTGTLTDAWVDTDSATAADSSTLAFSGISITNTDQLALASIGQCDDTATGITDNDTWTYLGTIHDSNVGSDGMSHTAKKSYASTGTKSVTFTFTSGGAVSTFGIAVVFKEVTVSLDLSGSPATVFGAAGVPEVDQLVTGAPAISFGAAGDPVSEAPFLELSGAPALVFGAAGEIELELLLSGAPSIVFGAAGSPVVEHELSGVVAVLFGAAGPLSQDLFLSGTVALMFGAAGTLTGPVPPFIDDRDRFFDPPPNAATPWPSDPTPHSATPWPSDPKPHSPE